ncbi:hypothetical protein [Micromonospora sp. KLBMP9576]|uniref:hypothetical protein n=1 Tax=Micromonospora sp. KLBMP9576 TaxID=3424769 RepID=UPI003D8A5443
MLRGATWQRLLPGLSVTRSKLPEGDLTGFAGLPVTTPLRTAFDLRAAGWIVLRCTADDVLRHRDRTVRLVTAALREHADERDSRAHIHPR